MVTIALNCQPFRGHREVTGVVYKGHFLSQVELSGEFDSVMRERLVNPEKKTKKTPAKYHSSFILRELTSLLEAHLQHKIFFRNQLRPVLPIINDTFLEIDQLSPIFQFMKIIEGNKCCAKEE